MQNEIKIPAMGESISSATVGNILKQSGSIVSMDDEILELETDKVNQVLYAQASGTLTLNVKTGDVVKIGQIIGRIDVKQGVEVKKKEPEIKTETPKEEKKSEPPKPETKAAEASIPSDSKARYSKDDFVASLKSPEVKLKEKPKVVSSRTETRTKMSKIRQVIAKRLLEAQHTTAMLTTFNEIDMSQVMLLREKYKDIFLKAHGVKLGFMSFFVKACVAALHSFPGLNSYIEGDDLIHREYYDIGIAVSTERGLIVPVLRNCDQLTFAEIEGGIENFAKKARTGGISVDDLQGGGFTITNGGVFGSLLSTPILNPPQSGILGMHKIMKRAVVLDDQIIIRPMMYVALSYDHRIVDGREAVSFLVEIKNFLEDPARLVLDV